MNIWEAIAAALPGERIRRREWGPGDFIEYSHGEWKDELGEEYLFECAPWEPGAGIWEIYNSPKSHLELARTSFDAGKFEDIDLAVVVGLLLKHFETGGVNG